MTNESTTASRFTLVRHFTAVLAALMLVFGLVAPGTANAKAKKVKISGDAVLSDCNNGKGDGALELSGDLEGCWIFFVKSSSCEELNGFALYNESGRETFVGSFQGEEGKFRTRYTLQATFAQGACADIEDGDYDTFFSKQLTGGCDHKVRGKTGVFKAMKGNITYHDIIPEPGVSGASNYFYQGYLK